jgi:peptide-N4-(N-acetyl-beta-glucosaminyl)asparagine amidase
MLFAFMISGCFLNRVVEGSDDGGSSWRILDKQTSQMFKNRFQRKSFKINSDSVPCNTFR